jgi:predicted amino acid racemase
MAISINIRGDTMETPILEIDLDKIKSNATKLKSIFDEKNINIMFITKGFCANTNIISAVETVGIKYFGDSRMSNIIKVKKDKPYLDYTLIRIPKISELESMIDYCSTSLQSELLMIKRASKMAILKGKVHNIILMVDVGDLREGVLIEDVIETVEEIIKLDGVNLIGIGTNVGCYGSIMPSKENTDILVKLKNKIKKECQYDISIISGGSTCTSNLIFNGTLAAGINFLRIGEAILFGEDSTNDKKIPGLIDDAFILKAEIIELKHKPSYPIGQMGKDAFGRITEYIDYGNIDRAILAIGRQDVVIEALDPIDSNIKILGGSSDHMICYLNPMTEYKLGDLISFRCSYSAVLSATTSPFVMKECSTEKVYG